MMTCPKCGKEVPEGTLTCPECGAEMAERPVRRVPNIPRREPDSLPERPGQGTVYSKWPTRTIVMLIAAAAVIAFLVWAIK